MSLMRLIAETAGRQFPFEDDNIGTWINNFGSVFKFCSVIFPMLFYFLTVSLLYNVVEMHRIFKTRVERIFALLPEPGSPEGSDLDVSEHEDYDHALDQLDNEALLEHAEEVCEILGTEIHEISADGILVNGNPSPVEEPRPSTSSTPLHRPSTSALLQISASTRSNRVSRNGLQVKQGRVTKKKKAKKIVVKWNWSKSKSFKCEVTIPEDQFEPCDPSTPVQNPMWYFNLFFDQQVATIILEQSNIYLTQKSGGVASNQITNKDLADFLRVELYMSVVKMPSYVDYWKCTTRFSPIADCMTLKRYEFLRRHLHFANNAFEKLSNDRYYKVRDLFETIRQNFQKIPATRRQSVDEMTVPYKGKKAGSRKQYNPKKPKKWGLKAFARCGTDGFVHDILLYDADNTFDRIEFTEKDEGFSFSAKVVIALTKSMPEPALHALYFDNWYTSLSLLVHLRKEYGILALGTVKENRLEGLKLIDEKALKRLGRGASDSRVDNKNQVCVTKWMDNRPVVVTSTYIPTELESIKRWCKMQRERVDVPCPRAIKEYNQFMGGVDLMDMLVALYRTAYRSHKWYQCVFSQMFDLCVNNAWILYKRDVGLENAKRKVGRKAQKKGSENKLLKPMRLKEFRIDLARSMHVGPSIQRTHSERTVPAPHPTHTVRLDDTGHYPEKGTRGRCRLCQKYTFVYCEKCDIRLCFVDERNCFKDYHVN